MKRCPQCRRDYYDETLLYCLDDGNALLEGPASGGGSEPSASAGDEFNDGPRTAILHETVPPSEGVTRAQIHMTDPTTVFPRGADAEHQNNLDDSSQKQSISANGAAEPRGKVGSRQRLFAVVGIVGLVLIGSFFVYKYLVPAKQIESIAVMPFVNESGNPDIEFLSDGMTETLIKSLSQIPNMNVRPRSSVFRYKGKDTDLPTIGKELNVQAILNGRVAQRGDQLTLSLELVDVQNNRVIWTEQYQRSQADIVSLQGEIARDVSANLSPQISGDDETKVSKQATADPGAYQAYLRGRYYWNKRTGEDINKAVEQFQIAIDRDPNYALAYAGMADAYSIFRDYTLNAPADSMSRAEGYAKRALAIDGQLAEPHATLGNVYYNDWQWTNAETEYKRAIELNPKYATAYHWDSVLLFALGRNEEGAAMILKAQQLDPLSNIINQNVAQMYRMKKDYQSAIETCRKIIDIDSEFPGGHFAIAWSYLKTGRNNEAIAEFQKAVDLNGRQSGSIAELGAALAVSGRPNEARDLIKELEGRYEKEQATGVDIATIYAALGAKDKAFEWLDKDFTTRSARLAEFRWSEASEPLRDDPRFKDIMARMGLPQ